MTTDTHVTPPAEIRVLLFDVGGVLVELEGVQQMLAWLEHRIDHTELWRRWLHSPTVRAFESGRSDAQTFALGVLREFELAGDASAFLHAFTAWPTRLFPGTLELLERIPARFTRALLSNSNTLHWSRIMQDMGLGAAVQHHFASHLTGRIKPDADAFVHVLESLGCAASSVLFLDDNQLNVSAAVAVGMQARVAQGLTGVAAALTEFGVLAQPHV